VVYSCQSPVIVIGDSTGISEDQLPGEGVVIRPLKAKLWEPLFRRRVRVDWERTLAVSLENLSVDDLMLR